MVLRCLLRVAICIGVSWRLFVWLQSASRSRSHDTVASCIFLTYHGTECGSGLER